MRFNIMNNEFKNGLEKTSMGSMGDNTVTMH